jgi:hypothetical protein
VKREREMKRDSYPPLCEVNRSQSSELFTTHQVLSQFKESKVKSNRVERIVCVCGNGEAAHKD